MADRIVLINQGRVEQIATPQRLFDCPDTLFAATFIGEPAMNAIPARLTQEGGNFLLGIGTSKVPLDADWVRTGAPISPTAAYIAGIRPQHIELAAADAAGANVVRGKVFAAETLGSRIIFDIEVEGAVVRVLTGVDAGRRFPHAIGSPIAFRVDPDFIYLFEATGGQTVRQAQFSRRVTH